MKLVTRAALMVAGLTLIGCSATSTPPSPAGISDAAFRVQAKPALPRVLPPDARHNYTELVADWWTWALTIPFDEHPLLQSGTVDLSAFQPDRGTNIWFLGGSFGASNVVREGTVPTGTALFFPLVNRVYVEDVRVATGQLESPFPGDTTDYPLDIDEYRSFISFFDAAGNPTVTGLTLTIDGETATQSRLLPYYAESPIFEYDLLPGTLFDVACASETPGPVNNCWRTDTTRIQAFGNGYYALVNPLPPGDHTIRFTGTQGTNTQTVTYVLHVEPGR